jgi:drug/metabolite transporter (DMT)-like permease
MQAADDSKTATTDGPSTFDLRHPSLSSSRHAQACLWLLVATVLWGVSFPLIKSILLRQQALIAEPGSAFLAALAVVIRFGAGAVLMALFSWRTLPSLTRNEFRQGLTLAFFGGVGIVLQMDGLAHTSASTSAFLTQFYILILPIWVAVKSRVRPTPRVIISCALVLIGVAILTGVDLKDLRIGRGELETLLAAIFFAGQILCLNNPKYATNRAGNFTVIMFALTAALALPVAVAFAPSPAAFWTAYSDTPILLMTTTLVLFCTLGSYVLMNVWQRYVTPTQAGIIYCLEPVAASAFALFLPAFLSRAAAIDYANERLTATLLIGGILILTANVLIQLDGRRARAQAKS